jgi:ribonuclease P/MRP protein subunit POP8
MDILSIRGRDIWLRIPRRDARAFRASLAGWVGSCEGDDIPGLQQLQQQEGGGGGGGRVGVAWRVVREGGVLGGLTTDGDGGGEELFG